MTDIPMCGALDVASWQRENRVAVYPDRVNRWTFARTLRKSPSNSAIDDQSMQEELIRLYAWWYGTIWQQAFDPHLPRNPTDETYVGPAEGLKVVGSQTARWPSLPTLHQGWGTPEKTASELTTPILIWDPDAQPQAYLDVEFTWRSPVTDVAWPVYSELTLVPGLLALEGQCPLLAQWALWRQYAPKPGAAPQERSRNERATDAVTENLPSSTEIVIGLGALAVIGMTVATLYYVPRKRG